MNSENIPTAKIFSSNDDERGLMQITGKDVNGSDYFLVMPLEEVVNKVHKVSVLVYASYRNEDDEYETLIVQKVNDSSRTYPGRWTIPGGKLEYTMNSVDNETLEATGARELAEEVGIIVSSDDLEYVDNFLQDVPGKGVCLFVVFEVEVNSKAVTLQKEELQGYRWVKTCDIPIYEPYQPRIRTLLERLGY